MNFFDTESNFFFCCFFVFIFGGGGGGRGVFLYTLTRNPNLTKISFFFFLGGWGLGGWGGGDW